MTFSSMNTSLIKPLMRLVLTGAYDRDQSTTPDVVKISKLSSMVESGVKIKVKNRSQEGRRGGGVERNPLKECLGRSQGAKIPVVPAPMLPVRYLRAKIANLSFNTGTLKG